MGGLMQEAVLDALGGVIDPASGRDIVSAGMVSGVVVRDGNVTFAIEVEAARGEEMEPVRKAAEAAVFGMEGVSSVSAVLTAHRQAPAGADARADARTNARTDARADAGAATQPRTKLVPEVDAIVAVASGKGGVGKSTVAVNLALGLARLGLATGILDADIYGPSMPRMLGISGRPHSPDGKHLEPMVAHGVKVMSIGFLVPEDTAMIWRGPMVISALEQMLRDVRWGALDVMVVDMPPGTGDAQLTMAQRVPLAGAVIVSTPQDIALLDARRGLNMFRKVEVPVFGIVENMSYFRCPHCGERTEIFGHGGAREEARRLGCDFLGEVPLDADIRRSCDMGAPIVAADSAHAEAYMAIARAVAEKLAAQPGGPPPPSIAMQ